MGDLGGSPHLQTDSDRSTDRQTDRQIDRQTQTDKQTDRRAPQTNTLPHPGPLGTPRSDSEGGVEPFELTI